jgi:rare lipoprotein A
MDTTIKATAAGRSAFWRVLSAGAVSVATTICISGAAQARELAPEVVSRVWLDGNAQVAAVTLNGDEIARFKSDKDCDEAADEAEDLAAKLQEVITDKKFDASLLAASKEDNKAVLKHDGATVCTFNPFAGQDRNDDMKKQTAAAYDASIKLVNAVRLAFGVQVLPTGSVNDMAEKLGAKLEQLGQTFSGAASWYGGRFHGKKCSDGSKFNQERLTAAHRSLPFGTKILVKNRSTGDTCIVEVNDRGPFIDGRVIDLSKAAAKELNMLSSGVAYVECTVLQ